MRVILISIGLLISTLIIISQILPVFSAGGDITGTWSLNTSMNTSRCRFEAVNVGPYIYAIAGQPHIDFNQLTSVERTQIQPDGSLSPWTFDAPLPRERTSFGAIAAVSNANYIYVIGGWDEMPFDSVLRSAVNTDGTLANWEQVTSLSVPITDLEAVRYQNHIYAISGRRVQHTTIQTDGSLTPWIIETPLLVENRAFFGAAVIKNYLYVIGGQSSGLIKKTVERTLINPDGSLNEFQIVNNLTTNRSDLAVVAIDNYLYAIGGYSGNPLNPILRSMERAPINPDGSIGSWQLMSQQMVDRRMAHESLAVNNHLYALGGTTTGTDCSPRTERIPVDRDIPTPTPTFSPTLTPTPTPTPPCTLPNFGDASGNPLRQKDPRWKNTSYGGTYFTKPDGTRVFLPFKWDANGDDSIGRWGCNLTSSAMIINYFAQQQGSTFRTDPQMLNKWLQENKGYGSGDPLPSAKDPQYVIEGYVRADKVQEYAKKNGNVRLSYDGKDKKEPNESVENFMARTRNTLNYYMCRLNPVILGVNNFGHYVTSSALIGSQNTWQIHDPLSTHRTKLNDLYNNQYVQITKFSDSGPHKSLSIAGYSPIEMVITDPAGRKVGFDLTNQQTLTQIPNSSYGIESLGADDEPYDVISHLALDIPDAMSGVYTLEVTGTGAGEYTLEIMAMDENYNETTKLITRNTVKGAKDVYSLNFTEQITDNMLQITQNVEIDVKPGSPDNTISCKKGTGVIPVAILTTSSFDASLVDHASVEFMGAKETHIHPAGKPQRHIEDIDGDGDLDVMFHFRYADTNVNCATTQVTLTGTTSDKHQIQGENSVTMIQK